MTALWPTSFNALFPEAQGLANPHDYCDSSDTATYSNYLILSGIVLFEYGDAGSFCYMNTVIRIRRYSMVQCCLVAISSKITMTCRNSKSAYCIVTGIYASGLVNWTTLRSRWRSSLEISPVYPAVPIPYRSYCVAVGSASRTSTVILPRTQLLAPAKPDVDYR